MGNRLWLQVQVGVALTFAELRAGWQAAGWAGQFTLWFLPTFVLAMLVASGLQGTLAPHPAPTLIEVALGLAAGLFTLARVTEATDGAPFARWHLRPHRSGCRFMARLRALATSHVGLATGAGLLAFEPTTPVQTLLFSATAGCLAWFCVYMYGYLHGELMG